MILNFVKDYPDLTLTRVVFERDTIKNGDVIGGDLTLTRVVFELR